MTSNIDKWTPLSAALPEHPPVRAVSHPQSRSAYLLTPAAHPSKNRMPDPGTAKMMPKSRFGTAVGPSGMTTTGVSRQKLVQSQASESLRVNRWEILRNISKAGKILGLKSGVLETLDAIMSFHRGDDLVLGHRLIVFASNKKICVRAKGKGESTVRGHIAALVKAGIISRVSSPNNKRYARLGAGKEVIGAFGLDLSLMVVRGEEFAARAKQIDDEELRRKFFKDELSNVLRELKTIIAQAVAADATDDWERINARIAALPRRLSSLTVFQLEEMIAEMQQIRLEVDNILINVRNSEQSGANAIEIERHIQETKIVSLYEEDSAGENAHGLDIEQSPVISKKLSGNIALDQLARVFPSIADYGTSGKISCQRELLDAADRARLALGISGQGYRRACRLIGQGDAAATIAYILDRAIHVKSPGAYLNDLTNKYVLGEYSAADTIGTLLLRSHAASASKSKSDGEISRDG